MTPIGPSMMPSGNHRLSNRDGLAVPPFSRDPRPAGSQPPFGAGQSLNPYPRLPSGVRFLQHPLPPRPPVHPHGRPPTSLWKQWGLPRSTRVPFPEGVRLRLSAGGTTSARGDIATPLPRHLPFGPSLSASLACCGSRRLNSASSGKEETSRSPPPLRTERATFTALGSSLDKAP